MRRRTLLVLCALCSVSIMVLWVMSYWQAPSVLWSGRDFRLIEVAIHRGSVAAGVRHFDLLIDARALQSEVVMLGGRLSFRLMSPRHAWPWKRWGLTWQLNPGGRPIQQVFFGAWIPATLFGAAAYILARPLLAARRRRRHGLCVSCQYDLTGNESGVCPECGSPISNQRPTQ